MTSHHPSELDCGTADSVASSPRSDHPLPGSHKSHEDFQPRIRFMCSFGGQILPRPHDNQLRYVGGDTRIIAVNRSTSFSSFLTKLSKICGTTEIAIKYQLPNEDLDALISVSTDEDVENMMEECDRLTQDVNPKTARLRLFLFPIGTSRASSISSISSLLGGSARREHWFFDALNGGLGSASLDRGRSEVSSIISEVPDYLFGLDNSEETRESLKPKNRPVLADNVSISDPGSPAPFTSSPYSSISAPPFLISIPDLPPVKTKPENLAPAVDPKENQVESLAGTGEPQIPLQTGYFGNPVWQYMPPEAHYPGSAVQPMPVYYVSGGNVQGQPVPLPSQYVQRFPVPSGQVPMGYQQHPVHGVGQMYGAGMRPVTAVEAYEFPAGGVADGVGQKVYYGARHPGPFQG